MRTLLTIILALQICLTFAQGSNELPVKLNSITIASGYTQFKDENIHPKVFGGYALGFRTSVPGLLKIYQNILQDLKSRL